MIKSLVTATLSNCFLNFTRLGLGECSVSGHWSAVTNKVISRDQCCPWSPGSLLCTALHRSARLSPGGQTGDTVPYNAKWGLTSRILMSDYHNDKNIFKSADNVIYLRENVFLLYETSHYLNRLFREK